jgi:hypothetical protein
MSKSALTRFILHAGVGNQMFEYAAGLGIARDLDLPFACMWEPSTRREFGLGHFGITPVPFRNLQPITPHYGQGNAEIVETIKQAVRDNGGPVCCIRSPFQAEECFANVADEVRKLYHLDPLALPSHAGKTPVGVQVRRGDYVGHRTLDVTNRDYFIAAMALIRDRIPNPHFFVISDDPVWCKTMFTYLPDVTVMPPQKPIDGLRTMVACEAHIISNSTFGWWGAWLGESGPVVVPDRWHTEVGRYGRWQPAPDRWLRASTRSVEPFALADPPDLDRAIVIPWKDEASKWHELRYLLRSIHVNFEDKDCPIYILGNRRPGWLLLKSGRVRYIDRWSYREALVTGVQLAKHVLWCNDDQAFLKPTTWEDVARPLHLGPVGQGFLDQIEGSENTWRQGVLRVICDLRTNDDITEPMLFSTHTPYLYERDKAIEIFRRYGVFDKMPLEMVYGNLHWKDATHAGEHRACGVPFGEARYLSYTDRTLFQGIKDAVAAAFPNRAPWEGTTPFTP